MTTYYVAASGGNDAANGLTEGTALATVKHAIEDHAVAGDTVILLDGAHEAADGHVISVSPASTITIQAANAGAASLTSANGYTGTTLFLQYINLHWVGIVFEAGAHAHAVMINSASAADLSFTNCTFNSTTDGGNGFLVNTRNTQRLTFTGCAFTSTGTAKGFKGTGATTAGAWTFTNCTFATTGNSIECLTSIAGITISGCTITATAAGSYGVKITGASVSNVVITGTTATGEIRGVSIDGAANDVYVDGVNVSSCVIAASNETSEDGSCTALQFGNAKDVVITDCDCRSLEYGLKAQGQIENIAMTRCYFAGSTAIGAWVGGASSSYPMHGNIVVEDCISAGTGTAGKGFAFGIAIANATLTVKRLLAKSTENDLAMRIVNNTATEASPWSNVTLSVTDTYVDGGLIVGTGYDSSTFQNCTVVCQDDGSALEIRRGIAGATLAFIDCKFLNAPDSSGDFLVRFDGTQQARFTRCSFISSGIAGRVFDSAVNDTGEKVEGFELQGCYIVAPVGGVVYNFPAAYMEATANVKISGSAITMLANTTTFGNILGTVVGSAIADVRTEWDKQASMTGNDSTSVKAGRKGQYGLGRKIIRLL